MAKRRSATTITIKGSGTMAAIYALVSATDHAATAAQLAAELAAANQERDLLLALLWSVGNGTLEVGNSQWELWDDIRPVAYRLGSTDSLPVLSAIPADVAERLVADYRAAMAGEVHG